MRASARSGISPFYVMEVMKSAAERADRLGDVLHLEVGQPSTPAPRLALEAAAATPTQLVFRRCVGGSPGCTPIAMGSRSIRGGWW